MAKKILIADDDELIRGLVKTSLKDEGYEFFEAEDGLQALKMAKDKVPDLLILDIMMPGMIGYQVCKELKNDPKTNKIQIIFLTSRSSSFSIGNTSQMGGGDGLITKPFNPLELSAWVKKILGT